MLSGRTLDEKVRGNKVLAIMFGMYPIYILFALTTIIFSNHTFIQTYGTQLMIVVTVYTVLLMVYNILTWNIRSNRLLEYSFLIFCALALLSYLLIRDPAGRARDNVLMIPVNWFVLACAHCEYEEEERMKPFIVTVVVFSIALSAWNLVNLIQSMDVLGTGRLTGISNNPARLGEMACVAIISLIMLSIMASRTWQRIACIALALVNAASIHFADSRGSLLSLAAGLFILAIIFASKLLRRRTFVIGLAILFVILVIALTGIVFSRMDIDEFRFDYETINTLTTNRLDVYSEGLGLFAEHPFRGHTIQEFRSLPSSSDSERHHMHNIYLDLAVRYGIQASLAFAVYTIGILVYSIRMLLRLDRKALFTRRSLIFITAFAIYACVLMQNMTDTYIFMNGYSASNCFFYLSAGMLTYFITKDGKTAS